MIGSRAFASRMCLRPDKMVSGEVVIMDELAEERAVFEANLETWRREQLGRFVLIKGPEVIGFFPSLGAAFAEGSKRYGLKDFFIQQILPAATTNISFFGQRF